MNNLIVASARFARRSVNKMNFYGTISRISPLGEGIEIRLSEGYVFDEAFEKPVRVITAEKCLSIPEELDKLKGSEIDEYEIREDGIDLWFTWDSSRIPLQIEASGFTEKNEEYDLQEYSEALERFRAEWQRQQKEIHQAKMKLQEVSKFLDHELDNIKRRLEFQPEKLDKYSKAQSILLNLKHKIETPNQPVFLR